MVTTAFSSARAAAGNVNALSRSLRGLVTPLLGASALGIGLTGNLRGIAFQGGSASNAMGGLSAALAELKRPFGDLSISVQDWTKQQNKWVQGMITAGLWAGSLAGSLAILRKVFPGLNNAISRGSARVAGLSSRLFNAGNRASRLATNLDKARLSQTKFSQASPRLTTASNAGRIGRIAGRAGGVAGAALGPAVAGGLAYAGSERQGLARTLDATRAANTAAGVGAFGPFGFLVPQATRFLNHLTDEAIRVGHPQHGRQVTINNNVTIVAPTTQERVDEWLQDPAYNQSLNGGR